MQVTRATFIPLLIPANSDRADPAAVREEAFGGLAVVYTFGPDFGRRLVTHADLDQLQLPPRVLRRSALEHLEVLSSRAEFHGQPPALMLSFEGLESSLLLANDFWSRLEGAVPGELVVGVPARDVVIVTGSQSGPGLEKAKRCVERVFFAGGQNLISRNLLVRRAGGWEPFERSARPSGRPTFGPAHQHGVGQPPRQYQEHISWPGERIPLHGHGAGVPGGPAPVRRRPMYPMHPVAPAAQAAASAMEMAAPHGLDTTGQHVMDMTGTHVPRQPMPGMGMAPVHRAEPVQREQAHRAEPAQRDWASEVAESVQYSAVPYSAVPYSAMPYATSPVPGPVATPVSAQTAMPQSVMSQSVMPQSVMPQSVMPQSVMPQSAVPYSAVPYSTVPYSTVPYSTVPYSTVPYSTGGYEAPSYGTPLRSRVRERGSGYVYQEPARPSYQDEAYPTGTLPRAVFPDYAPATPEPPAPAYPSSWGTAPDAGSRRTTQFVTGPRARFSR